MLIEKGMVHNMTYYNANSLTIRDMQFEDAEVFYNTYLSYGWHPSMETYTGYYKDQLDNKRKVFVAVYEGNIAGICTLVLNPEEGPFGNKNIPEIVDFGVFYTRWHRRMVSGQAVRSICSLCE